MARSLITKLYGKAKWVCGNFGNGCLQINTDKLDGTVDQKITCRFCGREYRLVADILRVK